MSIEREHREFHRVDTDEGWEVPAGYPDGIEQRIPSGGLDEEHREGARTRLLRFRPGARTSEPFVHDYWEEVLVSGDLIVGSHDGERETCNPDTYACHPPGVLHGPFESTGGACCLLLESHYYAP